MTRPPKMPASAIRSMVESRNAPQVPLVPFSRASTPSSMSRNTKIVQVKAPGNSSPRGKRASAAPATPTVPMTVMAFGVMGVRARTLPAGVNRRVMAGRSTFSMAVRSYRRPELEFPPLGRASLSGNRGDSFRGGCGHGARGLRLVVRSSVGPGGDPRTPSLGDPPPQPPPLHQEGKPPGQEQEKGGGGARAGARAPRPNGREGLVAAVA